MIVSCLNCNNIQEITIKDVRNDDMGDYTVCNECGGSFDVDFDENKYYGINYLMSLKREQLLDLMKKHNYESGYEDFSNEELIEILNNIEV